ncbi:Csu type fimbrial protein [Agrobacterium sp. rho-8.1]|nr:spore coat U domain-containing protein [Agrobacterium sp. rho-8.1]
MAFRVSRGLLIVAGFLFGPSLSLAQVATTTFAVQMTIQGECKINSAGTLNFGNRVLLDSNVDQTSDIVVLCTASTPFTIGLSAGSGANATVSNRLLTSAGGATIGYSLYTNSARTSVWGNTVGVDRQASTGTGAAQNFTVFGRVAAQTTPVIGTYNDTVTVTINY